MSLGDWLPWVRGRRNDELAEEMRAHLEMAQADRVARGESPGAAAANARREFGNPDLAREVAREQWGAVGMWVEHLAQDARFALRTLRRAPGFTTIATLTIALGVGATTAIFSVVNATLLHPLPYPRPDQLVRIEDDLVGVGSRDVGMSTPEWRDLERSGVFSDIAPAWFDNNNLTGLAHPQRVKLFIVSTNYFSLLGVKPQLGVTFDPNDTNPTFNGQAVISDGLWKRAFGGSPSVLGRVVQLDSDSYTIVGVTPPGFQAPAAAAEQRGTEIWVGFGFAGAPLGPVTVASRAPLFPGAIARLQRGLTLEAAQRRVDALVQTLRREHPADYPAASDWRVRLVPLKDKVIGDVRQPLLFLLGAVAFVLIIGCANVANLLLVRATMRGRELAMRQALGADPRRIAHQLITESVVLSIIGGLLGIAVVFILRGSFVRLIPENVPRLNDIAIDWGVLLFALGASLVSGVMFGLAPALDLRRVDVTRLLKQEGRGATSSREQKRTRQWLVVAEFALSLVLLSAAGLLVRSFWRLLDAPLGFNPQNVTVVRTRLPYPNYRNEDLYATAGAEERFAREVIQRVGALPGVQAVALGSGAAVPLDHPEQDQAVVSAWFEGDRVRGHQPVLLNASEVTPAYFQLLGLPLLRGRLLGDFDTEQRAPVAVINEAMARSYWPGQDVLGKRFKLSHETRATPWTTVVGVVADARTESPATAGVPQLYVSLYQTEGKHLAVFVRGRVPIDVIARQVQTEVQSINPALPVFGAQTLVETVSGSLAVRRFSLELIGLFALTALLLAAIGIYGVISYTVTERTHEIGVRLALGAQRADVLRMVMRQGMQLAIAGVALGLVGAVVVSHAIASVLADVRPTDVVAFGAATVFLALVAAAATFLPARRAIYVDPSVALR